nr:hypothetical protein [Clostridium sp. C8-1-8]
MFCNQSNWQTLCEKCRDRKTAKEDGKFGIKNIIYSY